MIKTKTAALYFLYVLISVITILVVIEILGLAFVHWRYGQPGKHYGIFKKDAELRMIHRPNSFNRMTTLNNYGFRSVEDVNTLPDGAVRLMTFGGSTTFGYRLKTLETYPEQLKEKLRAISGYEKTQVYNAGTVCYSAGHNLIYMKRLLPKLKPDYVIINEGVNESLNAWVLMQDGVNLDLLRDYGILGKNYTQANWWEQNSVLVKIINALGYRMAEKNRLNDLAHPSGPKETDQLHPWLLKNFAYLLKEMIQTTRDNGAIPIVIRYAAYQKPRLNRLSELSAKIAKENGAAVCDIQAAFESSGIPMDQLLMDTGVHPTAKGAEIMAAELEKLILELEAKKKSNTETFAA